MNTPTPNRVNEVANYYPPQLHLPIQLHTGSCVSMHLNTSSKPLFLKVYSDGKSVSLVDGSGNDISNGGIPLSSLPLQLPIGRRNMDGMFLDIEGTQTASRVSADHCVLELAFDQKDKVPTVRFASANGQNGTVYHIERHELPEDEDDAKNECLQNMVPIMPPGTSRRFRLEGPQREEDEPQLQHSRECIIVQNMLGEHLAKLAFVKQNLYVYNNATKKYSQVPMGSSSLDLNFKNGDSITIKIWGSGTSSYGRERKPEGMYSDFEITNNGKSSIYTKNELLAFDSRQS